MSTTVRFLWVAAQCLNRSTDFNLILLFAQIHQSTINVLSYINCVKHENIRVATESQVNLNVSSQKQPLPCQNIRLSYLAASHLWPRQSRKQTTITEQPLYFKYLCLFSAIDSVGPASAWLNVFDWFQCSLNGLPCFIFDRRALKVVCSVFDLDQEIVQMNWNPDICARKVVGKV